MTFVQKLEREQSRLCEYLWEEWSRQMEEEV